MAYTQGPTLGKEDQIKKEVKEEQLYICDHESDDCNCVVNAKTNGFHGSQTVFCNYLGREVKFIPYTEEKEPKTKRKAIIEFYERLSNAEFVSIVQRDKDMEMISEVMIADIDIDRLRYGVPRKGDLFLAKDERLKMYGLDLAIINHRDLGSESIRLIVDEPLPEPETVDQVLEELISDIDKHGFTHDIGGNKGFRDHYWSYLVRLKEAKERSE